MAIYGRVMCHSLGQTSCLTYYPQTLGGVSAHERERIAARSTVVLRPSSSYHVQLCGGYTTLVRCTILSLGPMNLPKILRGLDTPFTLYIIHYIARTHDASIIRKNEPYSCFIKALGMLQTYVIRKRTQKRPTK